METAQSRRSSETHLPNTLTGVGGGALNLVLGFWAVAVQRVRIRRNGIVTLWTDGGHRNTCRTKDVKWFKSWSCVRLWKFLMLHTYIIHKLQGKTVKYKYLFYRFPHLFWQPEGCQGCCPFYLAPVLMCASWPMSCCRLLNRSHHPGEGHCWSELPSKGRRTLWEWWERQVDCTCYVQ